MSSKFFLPLLGICCAAIMSFSATAQAQSPLASTLSEKQQAIIPIAAFTAKGDEKKLKSVLEEGLQKGLTVNEIKEILIQMYAYTGFPRSLTGLNTFIALLDERKAKGIEDKVGKEATPLPEGTNMRKIGTENQTAIIGKPASGRVYEFAPTIDSFLKEHLFGAIFSRDVLDFKDRELATVSALASLPAPTQLSSHLKCCLVVGLTKEQLNEFIDVLEKTVGKPEAELAKKSFESILKNTTLSK